MKRKIFSQLSLLLALFTVVIGLSACSNQNSAVNSNSASSSSYNQNTTSNIPSPQTKQS